MSSLAPMYALLAESSKMKPYEEFERDWLANRRQETINKTELIQLAELKRAQEAAAAQRAFYQQHPELALGGGMQSVLGGGGAPLGPPGGGPMMQQQVMPGGQDLSRFANVSPQGGGPIPPNVMNQVMPTSTPPMQSTLGGPGPPPQQRQDPLLELMRNNPDAALAVQQRVQQFQEKRLDWQAKRMGYFGQVLQGVNSPESYAAARQEIGRVDSQAAAQLPPTYSKEALQPYITQAVDVAKNAELRLKAMHEQTEAAKLGIQLQNAGYQGLGTDVTGILRGLTPEQVTEFGGRTSAKAIAFATDQVKKLDIEKREKEGLAGAQATAQANQQARLDKTVSEAFGERTTKLYDAQTGQTVDSRMKVKDYEAMPAGRVKELSTNQTEQMENVNTSIPVIAQLQTHIDKLYGPGGVLARMTADERADLAANPQRWAQQYAQKYPELQQAQRFINSNASGLARALQGEKGAMAEGDVARAKEMLPQLETSLKVWPPSQIGMQSPDTRAVALRSMNSVVDLINGRVRTILGNEQFTHPKLHRYETAEEAQTAAGGTVTPPAVAPPELPIPPTTRLNPNLPPVPPTFGPGDPTQQLRPRPAPATGTTAPTARPTAPAPAPATRPAPPTATSTPAQDEAYRQSQGQGRPPAPVAPTPRPTPGRQSQAPTGTRLAGAPKYMELADVAEAMRQTGRSRREVEQRARELGYTVYGSKLKLPEVTMVG